MEKTVVARCFKCDWGMTATAEHMPEIAADHIRACPGPVVIRGGLDTTRISPPRWNVYQRGAAAGSGTVWCATRSIPKEEAHVRKD
jgi:hypothetical protein